MYYFIISDHNINGDIMNDKVIECVVTDCINCCNGKCQLDKILITNDNKNEYSKYNTICQSYEQRFKL